MRYLLEKRLCGSKDQELSGFKMGIGIQNSFTQQPAKDGVRIEFKA